jgi:hypothetical protein
MNTREYLLTCLIEECAEVQQRATKILRFGANEKRPGQDFNNTELLVGEINDLIGVLELLGENHILPDENTGAFDYEKQEAKKEKVKKYMGYSRQQGCLNDYWPEEYIVDITKPPIFPPNIIERENFWGVKETKESIAQTKKWDEYIKKYGEELEQNKSRPL